jgi:hypothetical protein
MNFALATDDDLPLNVAGNPDDPIFANRIAGSRRFGGLPPRVQHYPVKNRAMDR